MKKVIPNLLSALRLVLIPFLLWAIQINATSFCVGLILLAMVSDLLDGFLARRWQVASRRGTFVDALADFLFLFSGFLALAWMGVVPWWFLLLLLLSFAHFIEGLWRETPYDPIGKYIGAYLYGFLLLIFLVPNPWLHQLLLVIGTGYLLLILIYRQIRAGRKE